MSVWKKVMVAVSSGVTLVVMATVAASASGAGQAALRAAGARTVLMASTSSGNGAPRGGVTSGPGLGPVQITIGRSWTLDGPLVVRGTVTVTCGPFLSNSGDDTAQVTVEETPGAQVGHAPASAPITCDGARHPVPVSALVNDLPFRAGDGAVSVNANACGQDPSSFQFVCQTGSAVAPVTVK